MAFEEIGPGRETQWLVSLFPRLEELADRREVVDLVLKGRSRQRPGAPPRRTLADPADLGLAVLDLLGFVEPDGVPPPPPWGRLHVLGEVRAKRLVARDVHVDWSLPLVGAFRRSTPDRARSQLWRPFAKSAAPLKDQARGDNEQRRVEG